GGLQPQSPATIAPKSKDPSKRKDDELPPRATGCANACAIGAREVPAETRVSPTGICALASFTALGLALSSRRARRPRR
ncbi:MAG: hypothetical protein ABI175_21700, partial [Polyangiales bacterium]